MSRNVINQAVRKCYGNSASQNVKEMLNLMYTGNVQKSEISVTFTEIFQYLKCSFSSCKTCQYFQLGLLLLLKSLLILSLMIL